MSKKFMNWWNDLSATGQFVIVVAIMATSPLWIIPAIVAFIISLCWTLIDSAVNGFG